MVAFISIYLPIISFYLHYLLAKVELILSSPRSLTEFYFLSTGLLKTPWNSVSPVVNYYNFTISFTTMS